jgi:TPR repeat protein
VARVHLLVHNCAMRIAMTIVISATLLGLATTAHADEAADIKACNAGKAVKCEELADKYVEAKDEAKSLTFLDKACTAKSSRACNNVGTAWSDGKNGATSIDHAKAKKYYEKACGMKNGLGCFNLGNIYRLGEGVAVDAKAAFANFKKSCDYDEAKGCTELGILYYEGKGVCKNVEILKKAAAKNP